MTSPWEYQLETRILRHCEAKGHRLASAESCTGGLIAHRLTSVAGASAVFMGGIVAYHNEVKLRVLGVSSETLERFGAVSGETVREMAERALGLFGADYALATSGIAGPTGGTPTKPVGLVFIGVAHPGGVQITRHQFDGDREQVQTGSAEKGLQLLAEVLGI